MRKFRFWPEDTIARRFALTVALSHVVAVVLAAVVTHFAGVWARPSAQEMGLFERADEIVRMVEATPAPQRQAVVNAADNATFRVGWYPAASTIAGMLDAAADPGTQQDQPGFQIDGHTRGV